MDSKGSPAFPSVESSGVMCLLVEQLHTGVEFLAAQFEERGGTPNHVDEAIILDRGALELCPPSHPLRCVSLTRLATHLWYRYNQVGAMMDLEEAIVLDRDALKLCPPGHSHRSMSLDNLAVRLSTRYKRLGSMEDLNAAIIFDRDALALRPPGHPDRSLSLNNLAGHLSTRYKRVGEMEDLNEAIALDRDALVLRPPGHPLRSSTLNNLAVDLSTRYQQLGEMGDLNEAIVLDQDALELCPPGHPDRSAALNNLAVRLSTRYNQLGEIEDLNEAIFLARGALALRPPRHPDRSMSLNNLAVHLCTRYSQLGVIEDVNEAIVLGRDALMLRPPGHPDRSISLNNLAARLSIRYHRLGEIEDLNEAIVLARDALELCSLGHPNRSVCLNNLADALSIRYKQLGVIEDLNMAIVLDRDALVLRPPGHPDRSTSLENLADGLSTRYKQLGAMEDLNEAIVLTQDALVLRPSGHPDQSMSLNNLANHLSARYKQLMAAEDLDRALVLAQDALILRPLGHPDRSVSLNDLASHLLIQYNQVREMMVLDEAIVLNREALELRPPGDPSRSESLENLSQCLYTRFMQQNKVEDREELFSLYAELKQVSQTVSSYDLSAAKAWVSVAEDLQHTTTVLAYETFIRLLIQNLATLPSLPQHLTILKKLASSFAVDAFSACLRNRALSTAVELLEQGRGIFWSQLTRLRSPLDDVIASGAAGKTLADEFTKLTSLIRNAFHSPGADQHNRVCHLNHELQRVVTDIRRLPSLSRFLLPLLFSDLQRAASGGPVIIVNASKYGCDALVILHDRDPVHIPLQITKARVRDLSSELRTLTVCAKSVDVTRDLGFILRKLWDEVVSHIVDFLQTTYPFQSRIWWCPTAEFSVLPLHAAGPYRKGQHNLADLYISSYTPTLTALIRARRPGLSNSSTEGKHFAAIGQVKAIGESELLSVESELANIGQRVDGLATFTRIEGPDSCIARVSEELSKNEWVHLACHGLPNQKQPFESAFALHDGHFTIEHIIQCEVKNPEFAYLSACHTTAGDEESPDEAIHLASAMQFAGFRSVIGTMWAVDDGQTNKITSMFYESMMDESGHLDHTRAAFALDETMKSIVDIPFDQRILYIHIGA